VIKPGYPLQTARVVVSLRNSEQSVELDGVDISKIVRSAEISGGATEVPQLTLTLNIERSITTEFNGGVVCLSPETQTLLVKLGWKPPEE
jgi:hypothetical protein